MRQRDEKQIEVQSIEILNQGFKYLCKINFIFTSPSDKIAYEKSPLLGLLKVIDQEIPGVRSRHLDLTVDETAVNAGRILQEMHVLSPKPEVAYRQGKRWIPRLEKVDFRSQQKQDFAFAQNGMYVISGGLGGVGVAHIPHPNCHKFIST